ncbi:MAG TPA: nucleoside triphosphate pyrophosphohydrolase [Candidatus Limnocylindrales bacterium]|nr:nucleoside triphosphate pyrophosphohydrolase [Candidatus Limnocylindrales bacterium]
MLDALVTEARLRFGLDPAAGLQIIASERLIGTPLEPSRPALVVPLAMLLAGGPAGADAGEASEARPLPGRHGPRGRDPLDVLARAYPGDHPVGRFGTHSATTIGELHADDLAAPFYLAPLEPEAAVAGPWAMPAISDRLRAPDGCPWDREQTHESLRNHLLEEAYEVYDALEAGATPELAGELGDLWLQIVLHAQLAAEENVFDLTDVQAAIASKIVRRHPHVFGEAEARTASDVNRQWERIKAAEREEADGNEGAPKGALDGISRSLPGLAASQEMQERAANIGYDWPSIEGVLDKVIEETEELREAAEDGAPAGAWAEELGDLLFVLVNVASKRGVDAEAAMRSANAKFKRRFGRVEAMVAERGVALRDLDFEALDELWDAVKAEERITT